MALRAVKTEDLVLFPSMEGWRVAPGWSGQLVTPRWLSVSFIAGIAICNNDSALIPQESGQKRAERATLRNLNIK
jgi:hypothetical protein